MIFKSAARLFLIGALTPAAFAFSEEPVQSPPQSEATASQAPSNSQDTTERKGVLRRRARKPSFTAMTRDQIVDQINAYRGRSARQAVVVNPELQTAAQSFAEHMARTAVFSHTADGRQPSMRAAQAGYESMMVTENIAYQGASGNLSQQLVNMWIGSPGHHANLMRQDLTETGVGVAQSPNGQYYAVQLFGRPGSRRFQVQVRNTTGEAQCYKLAQQEYSVAANATRTHSLGRKSDLTLAVAEKPAADAVIKPEKSEKFEIRAAEGDEKEVELVRYEVINTEDGK